MAWDEYNIQQYVETCATCSKNKNPQVKPRAELGSYHAGARIEQVYLDMMAPLPESDSRKKYIMVMVDQCNKWVEIQPLKDIFAETTACTVGGSILH